MGLELPNSAALVLPLFHVLQKFPGVPSPNKQEDGAQFREFAKRAEDGLSRASRLSKTFPEVPIVFRVSSDKPASRLRISLGLGRIKGWLGTWDAPELLTVSGS